MEYIKYLPFMEMEFEKHLSHEIKSIVAVVQTQQSNSQIHDPRCYETFEEAQKKIIQKLQEELEVINKQRRIITDAIKKAKDQKPKRPKPMRT